MKRDSDMRVKVHIQIEHSTTLIHGIDYFDRIMPFSVSLRFEILLAFTQTKLRLTL